MANFQDYRTFYLVCPKALSLDRHFFIFVNDIDTVVSSHIQKFADDCKVYRSVPTAEDIDILQQDINNLCQWSKDWQMLFNVKKCKALHIGHNNAYFDYSMNGEILPSVAEETDLGINVSNDLKPSKQCFSAVKKANMTLGMIKRHIVSKDKNTIVRLYKSRVRPKIVSEYVRILYTSMESVINQRYRTTWTSSTQSNQVDSWNSSLAISW